VTRQLCPTTTSGGEHSPEVVGVGARSMATERLSLMASYHPLGYVLSCR